jgi:ribosomal protein L29
MADQKLSAEELKALSPEELQELVIQNQEAYDKLQSETTK